MAYATPVVMTLAFTALLQCMTHGAQAQDSEAEILAFLVQRDKDIKAALARLDSDPEQEQYARSLVNDRIDFEEMGRRALGEYDAELTDAQRTDYVETFGAIVRAQSLSDVTVLSAEVTFKKVQVDGSHSRVLTTAALDGKQIPVEYLLHRRGDEWWLYDIILDGVGTIEGYAISFQSVIRKRGFDQLMVSLNKRRTSLEAEDT